ncbi:MAG: hypothetical protein JWQ16_2241 [Novosphingobium sp.]|nr:hypothetical protein [Novosphingobium sp.]
MRSIRWGLPLGMGRPPSSSGVHRAISTIMRFALQLWTNRRLCTARLCGCRVLRYLKHMDGGKSEAALNRIEAALERIEAVARHRDIVSDEWETRHDKLRDAVTRSLEQLDDLIADQPEATA